MKTKNNIKYIEKALASLVFAGLLLFTHYLIRPAYKTSKINEHLPKSIVSPEDELFVIFIYYASLIGGICLIIIGIAALIKYFTVALTK